MPFSSRMSAAPSTRRRRYRRAITATLVGIWLALACWEANKPLPPGVRVASAWHSVPTQDVTFIADITSADAYGRSISSQAIFDETLKVVRGAHDFLVLDYFMFNNRHGELDPALSQDGTGGIYATYLGGAGGAVDLSYSGDGGNSFATAVLNANASGGINDVASSVNAVGQGWASWAENGSVFAESFQAADAISAATIGSGATSEGSTVTLNVTCASFPCTVTIVLTAPETVVVHAASAHHTKGKTLTLGKGTITIKTKGDKKLKFKLSSAAHKLLKGKKGHFKVSALVSTQIEHHTTKLTKTLTLSLR